MNDPIIPRQTTIRTEKERTVHLCDVRDKRISGEAITRDAIRSDSVVVRNVLLPRNKLRFEVQTNWREPVLTEVAATCCSWKIYLLLLVLFLAAEWKIAYGFLQPALSYPT